MAWKCPKCGCDNGEEGICRECGYDDSRNYGVRLLPFPLPERVRREYALQSSDALLKEGIACLMKDQEKESAAKAAACFEKAAEKGSARAAYCMGFLYYCGVGTVRDMSLALEWYRRAAVMGDIMAASAVGDALLYGEAGVRNPREAVKWYRMGAGQGDPVCQFRLGCCLEEGNGVPMDQAAARQQYLLAALGGNREARKRLDMLNRTAALPSASVGGKTRDTGSPAGHSGSEEKTLPCWKAAGEGNVLRLFSSGSGVVFGRALPRKNIVSVTFLDRRIPAWRTSEPGWDVSAEGDGSVMAWLRRGQEGLELYIGGEGGIRAGVSCRSMFAGYSGLRRISFNRCFDTSQTVDMKYMFLGCGSLVELDVSGFQTSQVKDMSGMFASCHKLEQLDMEGFDTSQVRSMRQMFFGCTNLTRVKVRRFNTSRAADVSGMFEDCRSLLEPDPTQLDLPRAILRSNMLKGTEWEEME